MMLQVKKYIASLNSDTCLGSYCQISKVNNKVQIGVEDIYLVGAGRPQPSVIPTLAQLPGCGVRMQFSALAHLHCCRTRCEKQQIWTVAVIGPPILCDLHVHRGRSDCRTCCLKCRELVGRKMKNCIWFEASRDDQSNNQSINQIDRQFTAHLDKDLLTDRCSLQRHNKFTEFHDILVHFSRSYCSRCVISAIVIIHISYCRLSTCLWQSLLWLNDTSYSKSFWTNEQGVPRENDFTLQLSTPYSDHTLKLPLLEL